MKSIQMVLGLLAGLALLVPGLSMGASTLMIHNTDDTTEGSAVCMSAPRSETGQLVVNRIRVTSSRATATTYTFTHKRTSDSLLDTESLSGANCVAPACAAVLSLEGVVAGQVAELNNLNLVLPRGSRLYMSSSADIGANYQTVEVYYSQH